MDATRHDIRVALRGIAARPGVAAMTVATLAVGIGVVTTFFSFVNSALLRPLPYADSRRLVALSEANPRANIAFSRISLPSIEAIRQGVTAFERAAVFRQTYSRLSIGGQVVGVTGTEIDADLLSVLRTQPALGRAFTPQEVRNREPVVLISDSLWRQYFAARTDVVGRSLGVNGTIRQIVGVMPSGFRFDDRSDVWLPLTPPNVSTGGEIDRSYAAIGRLAAGATLDRAREEVHLTGQRLAAARPADYGGWSLVVRDGMVDRGARAWGSFAALVIGAALVVLLVACSNVANLLLARAEERRGEMAIRASLGASRARLIRQNLTESLLLALLAGALGVVLAEWGVNLTGVVVPLEHLPSWLRLGIDWRVLAFTFAVSLLTVVGVGLLPAMVATRVDLTTTLKESGDLSATTGRGTRRGRSVIVAELALTIVLFVGATLLARTYRNVTALDPGYQPERVLRLSVNLDSARYAGSSQRHAFEQQLAGRLAATPGIQGVAREGALDGLIADSTNRERGAGRNRGTDTSADITAAPDRRLFLPADVTRSLAAGVHPSPQFRVVSDEYFRVMGMGVTRGRSFDHGDRAESEPVVMVSARLARLVWGDGSPLGQRLQIGAKGTPLTVVGVVRDVRLLSSRMGIVNADPDPDLYLSERQATAWNTKVLARAAGEPGAVAPRVVEALRSVDPELVPFPIRTLATERQDGVALVRLLGGAVGSFALCALVLALIGIYGVCAYAVARRSRELAIRMALGARASTIVALVVRDGARLVIWGVGTGLVLAAALSRVLTRLLWGVTPVDALTYSSVAALFTVVALVACYLPARRTTRLQPVSALRRT
jgi:putative ABC transport system permease protein